MFMNDNSPEKFIINREKEYGGKVLFSSFAKYIGTSKSGFKKNLNGILYIINSTLYFEDFKPQQNILTMNQDVEYDKTILLFNIEDILEIKKIKEKDCDILISSKDCVDVLTFPKGITSFFHKPIILIKFEDNCSKIFDILNCDGFMKLFLNTKNDTNV